MKVVLFYGLGGSAIEYWSTGERALLQRFKDKGADAILLNWNQRQESYNFLHGYKGKRALLGDSLGAGSAVQYAGDLNDGTVDYCGGFQPSMDDARATKGEITVPANVSIAHCVHDTVWLDTMGLGQAIYVKTPGSKTIVFVTDHRGAHPDDWGYSQDLLFNEAMTHLGN